MENTEKQMEFYVPGDLCTLKKNIANKPESMLVVRKVNRVIKTEEGKYENVFVGIETLFFDKNGAPHTMTFNSKDLMHI